MIDKAKKLDTFIVGLEKSAKASESFGAIRREGLSRFQELDFPTVKDEEWKYTNLSSLTAQTFRLASEGRLTESAELNAYLNKDDVNIVFVNGIYSEELSNLGELPKGVEITKLGDALVNSNKELEGLFKKLKDIGEEVFSSLNQALTSDGLFIKAADKTVYEKVIHVVHVTSGAENIVTSPRTVITLGASSEITVLESHLSFSDKIRYFTNAMTDIILAENSTLHYCKAQDESEAAFHIGATRIWQERDSNFDGFSLMTGGGVVRNNLDVVLNGEGADAVLNGLYGVNGTQHVDNHTSVDHRVPNCTSNQLYKGILNGSSRAVFNGKIFVKPIAQQTNSYQLNKNLLLGDDCRVDTKPQLEIFADDVKCTHGATIGQLNEDEIFYLQTRAIPKKEAVQILARGFVDDTLDNIQNQSINAKLHKLIEPIFAAL